MRVATEYFALQCAKMILDTVGYSVGLWDMDRNMRAFLAVAKTGNLTAAAGEIGLTQPALTKTIRRLEADYGAALFERTSRGMVLTDAGETLLARARLIEMHYRQAHEEVAAARAVTPAQFRIASGAAYHMTIAPDLAKRLCAEFPQTRFVVDFNVAQLTLPKLLSGEIDLMLGAITSPQPEGIETHQLMTVEISPYCCRSNPLAREPVLDPETLRDTRWIIYKRDQLMADRLRIYFEDNRLPPPRVVMEVEALAASFRIVQQSGYLTLAPASLQEIAAEAGLARLATRTPIWSFSSGAWIRASSKRYAIMHRALQLLREACAVPEPGQFPQVMDVGT